MLALAEWRDRRCRRCGGDLEETTSDDHDADLPGSVAHYVRLPPVRCHRCTALAASEAKAKDNSYPHALIHRVELQLRRPRRPPG